jgi:hypothetical protein
MPYFQNRIRQMRVVRIQLGQLEKGGRQPQPQQLHQRLQLQLHLQRQQQH